MKSLIVILFLTFSITHAQAQFSSASLQASGLTCSMCSKAVKIALEKVSFVKGVDVDIKNQQYNLTFKNAAPVDFDVLAKAVEDAGFSVASLKVKAAVQNVAVKKDSHIKIGNQYFHFLNAQNQQLNGPASFTIVDKHFVSAKEFKKYSAATKMQCLQTGKSAKCCAQDDVTDGTRIYHAII